MITTRSLVLFVLIGVLPGCRNEPVCLLDGTWKVTALGCSGGTGGLRGPIDATYTFDGPHGHTRWALPGCTVEAYFDVESEGADVRIRERRHACSASEVPDGRAAIPCCESRDVDVALTYTCRASPEGLDWTASLAPTGDSGPGPWADRGPWRGCLAGDVGMMRLEASERSTE